MNLRLTDLDTKSNLNLAGGNLDSIKFVRNKNYLS